jgi:hypothetical protein
MKSLGSSKNHLDLLFLIVITLGYRARRDGRERRGQCVFGSMAGVFIAVYHRFKPSAVALALTVSPFPQRFN